MLQRSPDVAIGYCAQLAFVQAPVSSGEASQVLQAGADAPLQTFAVGAKVGIPNFVSGPRQYIMEGEYVILAMCSWFRIS